ncbi:MAG TPA: hypothetical protein VGG75_20595 [Trebonia sp.]
MTDNGTEPLTRTVVIDDKLGFIREIQDLTPGESHACEFGHHPGGCGGGLHPQHIHNTAFARGEDEVTGKEVYSPAKSPEAEAAVTGPPVVPVTG